MSAFPDCIIYITFSPQYVGFALLICLVLFWQACFSGGSYGRFARSRGGLLYALLTLARASLEV